MEMTVIVLLVVIILLAAYMLFREFSHVNGRVQKLEETTQEQANAIEGLKSQVEKLDRANRKRMPWEALENLEHARAALIKEKNEFQFFTSLIENAEEWLDQAMAEGTKREEK